MNEIIEKIRAQYPDYKDISDDDLTLKIADKYPAYLSNQSFSNDVSRLKGAQPAQTSTVKNSNPQESAGRIDAPPEMQVGDKGKGGAEPLSFWESINTPLVGEDTFHKGFTALNPIGYGISKLPQESTTAKVATGVQSGVEGLMRSFTSPLGIATLGIGKLPKLAQRIIAGGFAVHALSHAPEQAQALDKAIDEGDTKKAAQAATDLLANVAMGSAAGLHAIKPTMPIVPSKEVGAAIEPPINVESAKASSDAIVTETADKIAPVAKLTSEALKQSVKPKEENASEIPKTTEVHGDVREQPVVSQQEVPTEVSGQGVQPIPEAPQGEISLTQKYRIGNNPQTHTLVERLPQSESEKSLGEQPVSIKNDRTGEVQTVLEQDLTPVTERTAEEKASKSTKPSLDDQLRAAKLDPSVFPNAKSKREALKRAAAMDISVGPGARSPSDIPEGTNIKLLTQDLENALPSKAPLLDKISILEKAKTAAGGVKESIAGGLAKLKAIGNSMWRDYASEPQFGDEKRAVGKWTGANQRADFEARKFVKQIERTIPNKTTREAITNYIQADGDEAVLRERASKSSGDIKKGYETALKLTPDEKIHAGNIGAYLDAQLKTGMEEGILENGVENYVNQIWKRPNPVSRKLVSDFVYGKLQPNFKFAKKRIFDSYFEGEQAGYKPANKDIGALVAFYDQSFNKSLAARAFLKDLHEGKASDGRPLVEKAGSVRKPLTGEEGGVFIRPKSKPEDTWDYKSIDHPAMRGWKWAMEENGKPVFVESDLLVHPEAYRKLKNRLSSSIWRTYETESGIKPGAAILNTQSQLKQALLSISGFHQVQESLHALGHRVSPANLAKIDFDNPTQSALIEHGLQIADYHASEMFGEGLSSGPLIHKIPLIGKKILGPYTEYLFQDYIPRLKMTMAQHALERNMERYKGKLSPDQILELTSKQANAAFGELNYKYMGRNPSFQDTLRAFLLAPDFLEARAKFVGQALKPHGAEQLQALFLLAATQYVGARILNKVLDDDYHWDKRHMFSVVYKGKEYGLRTVPGDIQHLFQEPVKFAFNRLSPILGRANLEFWTGRDDRGVRRDLLEQAKDLLSNAVPISLKKRDDQSILESFLNSAGMHERRFTATSEIAEKARDFNKANKPTQPFEEIYDAEKDPYRPLRIALESGDIAKAQKVYDDLKKTVSVGAIGKNLNRHYNRPFTGSNAQEIKFRESLTPPEAKKYEAARSERQSALDTFNKLK